MTKPFTTQQAQYLKVVIADQIHTYEQAVTSSKNVITFLYDRCDKDQPEATAVWFKDMNRHKSALRWFKSEIKKLAELQRVVKQLAK